MTGTANHIPDNELMRPWYRQWQLWLMVSVCALGVFIGGVVSGYFMFRAESLQRTEQRDKKVDEIQKKLDTLPEQLKAAEQGDPK